MFHVLTVACRKTGVDPANNTQSRNLIPRWRPRNYRKCAGWVALVAYLPFLVFRVHSHDMAGPLAESPLWGLQGLHGPVGWIGELVLSVFWEFAYFATAGFLGAVIVPHNSGWLYWVPVSLRALVVVSMLAVLVCAVKIAGSPYPVGMVDLVLPLLGCLFGAWAGVTWLRGWRARLWFVPKVVCLALLAVLGMGLVVWLLLEEMPLSFEGASVTSAEKRRLADLTRGKSPGALKEGETCTVRLTEHDVNVLLSWGLSLGPADRKAKVSLDHDSVSLLVSAALPFGGRRPRYLNLEMVGSADIEAGVLNARADRCRIGSRKVPGLLLHPLCSLITSRLNRDPQLRPFLDAAREVVIEPNMVQLVWGPLDLHPGLAEGLLGHTVASEKLLASTRTQVDHLLVLFAISPQLDLQPSFNLCLMTAFALARERSADRSPVVENQAAILALGMLLGHPRIEAFIGQVFTDRDKDAAQRTINRVVLRGRPDWTRHFCLSAAIAVLSQEAVSDAIGLLKEELDADKGGSGFSFADLLADRAGTALAVAATRDEAAALAMQDRLAHGFSVDAVFPQADDMPEGVSSVEFESRYGGVGGKDYCRLIQEIERRITRCAAYQ
jgi:hypothetical protein